MGESYVPLSEQTKKLVNLDRLSKTDRLSVSLEEDGSRYIIKLWGEKSTISREANDYPYRFPERKRDWDYGGFTTPCTDISAAIIDAWPKGQLHITSDAMLVVKTSILESAGREICAKQTAEYKIEKKVPEHLFEINSELPLMEHQQVALCNVMGSQSYALFMEQGTGKTPIMVAAVCNLAKKKERRTPKDVFRAIVVCPKQVRLNWQNEFIRFSTAKGQIIRVGGGQIARMQKLIETLNVDPELDYVVAIMNYESLRTTWDGLQMVPWDCVILDESHFIKNHKAKRSRHAWKLRDRASRRYILTGTPVANTPMDLFSQLEFLEEGGSGFSKFDQFANFYAVFENRGGMRSIVDFQNLPFLRERLARMSFIVTKDEVMGDLPEKVYDKLEIEMTPQQKKVYTDLATVLIAQLEDELTGDVNTITVNNILTRLLRLAQITSGFIKYDDEISEDGETVSVGEIDRFDPNPKLDLLIEELKRRKEEQPNSKTIVWSCFTMNIKQIRARLELEGIKCVTYWGGVSDKDREEALRLYAEDPEYKVFIGNPAAGGAGLNLLGYQPGKEDNPCNTDWVVYFNNSWSSVHRRQSEDRAHRKGTRVQVRYTDIVAPATIDEMILDRLKAKADRANAIKDIKDILQNLLNMEV